MLPAVAPASAYRGGLWRGPSQRLDQLPHVVLHRGGVGGGEEANAILMSQTSSPPATAPRQDLPRNVKVLGLASLLNDTASEMIYPLLPHFLLTVLLGNRFHLGVIEGVADPVATFVTLWSAAPPAH